MSELRDPAHRVSPRARTMWLATTALQAALATVAALVVATIWLTAPWTWIVPATVAALGALAVAVVPQWRYRVHRWEATASAVYTQRGWWTRERRIAPMSRVQTVDFEQGVLDRVLGLASITVTTASAAGPLRIDGLEAPTALRLSEELTARAQLIEGDAT
ncbi:PH domain-containing protein [Nocardioides sp. GY 10113]|uniref:PH domain-containing protein n=1 Tax=Nocardioides sp. GY 10113 TaxID=2569761 RepID=UPI001F0FBD44|nr:PH domain-containing protein [Nocardioides sp. GY 10113]